MKKKEGSRIARLGNRILNIRVWFDFERIKAFSVYLWDGIKKFCIPQKKVSGESFAKVVAKMQITDADLQLKQKALWRLSVLMVSIAGLIFLYAIYNAVQGNIMAFILSIIVTLIALVLAFRYHFWYFQIKQRKLGCTFTEWFKALRGEHS